jgi:predicted Zn-dependent protease
MKKIIVIVSLLVTALASADTKVHGGAGISIWFPDNWKLAAQGDRMLAMEPQEEAALIMAVVDAPDVPKALASADAYLSQLVSDVKLSGQPKAITVNGLPAIRAEGTGKHDGKELSLGLIVVKGPKKTLLIVGMALTSKLGAHKATIGKIVSSVAPVK